jgi:hypothetical protein
MLCDNYNYIYDILADPDCFHSAKDDFIDLISLPAYIARMLDNKFVHILKPDKGTLFFAWPITAICWEIHTAILKNNRKQGARNAHKAGMWLLNNTTCRKVMSYVPDDNNPAKMFCAQIGMKRCGLLTNSVQRNNKLIDMILYSYEV